MAGRSHRSREAVGGPEDRPVSRRKEIAMPLLAVVIGMPLFITVCGALALLTRLGADELNSAGVAERP